MTLTINSRPLTPVTTCPEDIIPQWDINDTVLPKNAECGPFDDWCDGHCRRIYYDHDEDARKHTSGWAMRNTNNHNVSILKKSCLGVFLCNKRCTLANSDIVRIRPAICDKARRKQLAKPCPNTKCSGRLELVACRGHCGYPVTHFWRHYQGKIFFQSKGIHSHPQPELKSSAETRRHIQNCGGIGSNMGGIKQKLYRKKPYAIMERPIESLNKINQVNDVICSCSPFEHTCTHANIPASFPYLSSGYAHPTTTPASNAAQMPLCSVTFKMKYNGVPQYTDAAEMFNDRTPTTSQRYPEEDNISHPPCYINDNYITTCIDNEHAPDNISDSYQSRSAIAVNNQMSINSQFCNYNNVYYPRPENLQSMYGSSNIEETYHQFRISAQSHENSFEAKVIPDFINAYQKVFDEKPIVSETLPSCHELIYRTTESTNYHSQCDVLPTSSCQYAYEPLTRPPSCDYEKSPIRLTELQTVNTKDNRSSTESVPFFSCYTPNDDIFNAKQMHSPFGCELQCPERELNGRCHVGTSQAFKELDTGMSTASLNSVVSQTQQIHNHNINITLKYN